MGSFINRFFKKHNLHEERDIVDSEGRKIFSVYSPVDGELVKLEDVSDPTFRDGILGEGIAVMPQNGRVFSPANGIIESVFSAQHSLYLNCDSGIQIIIHAGIDTVMLNGKYHKALVKKGDKVKTGDPIMRFDLDHIVQEGYDPTVIILIANNSNYTNIVPKTKKNIASGELILSVYLE